MEIFVVIFILLIYFLPTIVAFVVDHPSLLGIFVLNLLAGWTILAWIIALVWSFTDPEPKDSDDTSTNMVEQIQKLADLREQGLISDEEYNKLKGKMLENA